MTTIESTNGFKNMYKGVDAQGVKRYQVMNIIQAPPREDDTQNFNGFKKDFVYNGTHNPNNKGFTIKPPIFNSETPSYSSSGIF